MAVDAAGDVFVTDYTPRVLKLPAGSNTPVELPFTGLKDPLGTAVNDAGDVYVTDCDVPDGRDSRVLKLPAGSNTAVELPFNGLRCPKGVVVDPPAMSTSPTLAATSAGYSNCRPGRTPRLNCPSRA